MRKLIYTLAGAAALASASVASAASVITGPTPDTLTPPASALFGANVTGGPTSFNDTFTFSIAGSPGVTDAQVTTLLLNGSQNIDFTSVTLDGLYNFSMTSTDPAPETFALLTPVLIGIGTHTINVVGNLIGPNGSYSGTINVQSPRSVPEAKTWIMMLLGFAGMGLVVRRSRLSQQAAPHAA